MTATKPALGFLGAEASDATILKDADIGTTVQAYDANTIAVAPGSNGDVLTVDGGEWTSAPAAAGGKVAQVVNLQDGSVFSTTSTIPADNTIPQNTEGAEWNTLSITPTDASSTLRVDVTLQGVTLSAAYSIIAALFRDSGANALAVAYTGFSNPGGYGGEENTITFSLFVSAGSTSATTFKVRVGGNTGTAKVNVTSAGGAAIFGGVVASTITITEYLP